MRLSSVVIDGAGHGGFQAAASLRQEGFAGAVRPLGAKPCPPCQRPPLSQACLKEGDAERLRCRPAAFYPKERIGYLDDARVTRIDRAGRRVRLEDGRSIPYDHLILATGVWNRARPIPGAGSRGVFELRDLADAERLRGAVRGARRIAVIGGGFIGLETAAAADQIRARKLLAQPTPPSLEEALGDAATPRAAVRPR